MYVQVCVMFAALAAGLTMGMLSLDDQMLSVLEQTDASPSPATQLLASVRLRAGETVCRRKGSVLKEASLLVRCDSSAIPMRERDIGRSWS